MVDSKIKMWLDGELVVNETTLRFRDVPDLKIDTLHFHTIFGGSKDDWKPSKNEQIEFGDVRIYEKRPG